MTHNRGERFSKDPARHHIDKEEQAHRRIDTEKGGIKTERFKYEGPESRPDRESQIKRYSELYGEFEPLHGPAPVTGATQGDDFSHSASGSEAAITPGRFAGRGPKGFKRSDERIQEDVCEMLARAPHIDASELEVSVKDGEVTLTGTLSDRKMKYAAEECAARCLGVKDVTNLIRIHREAKKTPATTPSLNPSH